MSDILDRIDTTIGCQQCGHSLDRSPSDDFCSQQCQEAWHAARSEALERYEEPSDLAVHVYNQREDTNPEVTPRAGGWFGNYMDQIQAALDMVAHSTVPAPLAGDPVAHGLSYIQSRYGQVAHWSSYRQRIVLGCDPFDDDMHTWQAIGYTYEGATFARPAEPVGEDEECE